VSDAAAAACVALGHSCILSFTCWSFVVVSSSGSIAIVHFVHKLLFVVFHPFGPDRWHYDAHLSSCAKHVIITHVTTIMKPIITSFFHLLELTHAL
jgi:hypothetical protein